MLLGAYLFGGVTMLQFHLQGLGIEVATQLLAMTPYLATIVVLALISRNPRWIRLNMPPRSASRSIRTPDRKSRQRAFQAWQRRESEHVVALGILGLRTDEPYQLLPLDNAPARERQHRQDRDPAVPRALFRRR